MDMKSKGIRWVESIYQTFETTCDNAESTTSQAPSKYIGNSVHTVGKGVKKFCSSVIQDLLPPKASSIKVDVPESSPVESDYIEGYIESKDMEKDEYYINAEAEQLDEVHGTAIKGNQGTENCLLSSSLVERHESNVYKSETFGKSFEIGTNAVFAPDSLSQSDVSSHSTITDLASSFTVEKCHSEGSAFYPVPYQDYEHIGTSFDGSDKHSTAKVEFTSHTNSLEGALPKGADTQNVAFLNVLANYTVSKPLGMFIHQGANASSSNCSINSFDSNKEDPFRVSDPENFSSSSGSMAERGCESSTLGSSMTFSDICISDKMCIESDPLAEAWSVDDLKFRESDLLTSRQAHFPSSQPRRSLKSYKKLLQDTLNSKKRVAKEYKQLGIWYGDIYEEHNSSRSVTSTLSPAKPPSPSRSEDVLSEWELL